MPLHAPQIHEFDSSAEAADQLPALYEEAIHDGDIILVPAEKVAAIVVAGIPQSATHDPGPRFIRAQSPGQWLDHEVSIEMLAPLLAERGWATSYLFQRVADAT
ncbi:hypothetical protein [Rhodococcus pyridinivorans]|uniref:hypothetical protein n=1 Tax=Rhodococcus pyridinivorans TaxID=103816 RepID=UPI002658CFFD|nr:hypothetical protein [Rhodococcus pyridinivorans]